MPSFAKMVTIQSTSFIINTMRIGAAHLTVPPGLIYRAPRGKGALKWLHGLRMGRRSPGPGGREEQRASGGGRRGDSCKARLGKFVL